MNTCKLRGIKDVYAEGKRQGMRIAVEAMQVKIIDFYDEYGYIDNFYVETDIDYRRVYTNI